MHMKEKTRNLGFFGSHNHSFEMFATMVLCLGNGMDMLMVLYTWYDVTVVYFEATMDISIMAFNILTERRNFEILKLLQIYMNDQKSKFRFTYVFKDILCTQNGKKVVANNTHMMYWRKEGRVIYSFTHLVGGLFITCIWACEAWKHGKRCQNTECLRSYIQYIVVRMGMCIRLTYVRLSIHSTHCHNGVFSLSIKFSVNFFLFSAQIEWQCFEYTNSTLGI